MLLDNFRGMYLFSKKSISTYIIQMTEKTIPKMVFIVPYRDREIQRRFFLRHMRYILEDYNQAEYEILIVHQQDQRDFNRGAIKNIGFLIVKEKYPDDYKDIILVFNDIDTVPCEKDLIKYETNHEVVKHFYGYNFALGGMFSITGKDFEKTGGFPNFWGWGYEDNAMQNRCNHMKIRIDRSNFYPILDKHMIQLQDGAHRLINRNDYLHYKNNTNEGYMNIGELKYTMDADVCTANVTYFTTGRNPSTTSRAWKDLTKTKHPFSNTRTGSMKMLL